MIFVNRHIATAALAASAALCLLGTAATANAAVVVPTTPDSNTVMTPPKEQTHGNSDYVPNNYIQSTLRMDDQVKRRAPKGANDWSCKPTAEHPNPVILVHGYASNPYVAWSGLAPFLKDHGFCVFGAAYGTEKNKSLAGYVPGFDGMGETFTSAMQIGQYVDAVREATGAKKVDLVSWSQGGLIVDTYLHYFGGADAKNPAKNKVGQFVSIAGAHHGSTLSGAGAALAKVSDIPGAEAPLRKVLDDLAGKAAFPMLPNSVLVADMLARGDTLPGVNYTIISSEYDTMITPIENTWMKAVPGATVTNVNLQKGCPNNHSDHHAIVFDPRAWDYTLIGLGTKGVTPRCVTTHPMIATGF